MLDRQHGKINFECDSCAHIYTSEVSDFDEAWAVAKRDGWKAQKIGKEWVHACPDCELDR